MGNSKTERYLEGMVRASLGRKGRNMEWQKGESPVTGDVGMVRYPTADEEARLDRIRASYDADCGPIPQHQILDRSHYIGLGQLDWI
jgi:hypothetical protein